MRGDKRLLALTAAVAVCSFLSTVLSAPTPVMVIFAFALLASLGYVWIEVILRGRAPTLDLVSIAVGLILAIPVIGGVVFQEAGISLRPVTWSLLFAGITLAGDAVLAFRYHGEARGGQYDRDDPFPAKPIEPDYLRRTRPDLRSSWDQTAAPSPQAAQHTIGRPPREKPWRRVSPWQVGACGLAVLITGGAIWFAQAGAASQQYPGFTELWLTDQTYSTSTNNLGVINHEGKTESYKLIVLVKGHASTVWSMTLGPGQTWQRTFKIGAATRANLYLLPDLKSPYRYVDTQP